MLQTLAQIPRLARVAQLGLKSGRMLQAGEGLSAASKAMKGSEVGSVAATAKRYGVAGERLAARAANTMNVAKNYGEYVGIDPATTSKVLNRAASFGRFIEPIATPTERIAGGLGKVGEQMMINPVGQMALFGIAPYAVMGAMQGGGEVPPETYAQPMDGYMPMPPMAQPSPEIMLPQPSLDEEQIKRARRRAEEQAALNQFYAQALQQYGGYQ
jgi:hypothetical protein